MDSKKIMELVKTHILSILSALSVLLLLLPIVVVVTSSESAYVGSQSASNAVNGFSILGVSIFGYFLLIGPALLLAMNYVKPLEPYKGLLAVAVPAVCAVCLIIFLIQAGSIYSASASSPYGSAKISCEVGLGAILLFISYGATMIAGAVTYHNFTLDKAGLEKLKESGANLFDSAKEKVQNIHFPQGGSGASSAAGEGVVASGEPAPAKPVKKSTNLNRMDEVLALIEKLSKMKEAGILTEEEFAAKKQQLLEEI